MSEPFDGGEILQRIGARLKALNISERQASIAAFGHAGGIRNIRHGQSKAPSVDFFAKLAEVLRCSAAWLAFGAQAPGDEEDGPRILGAVSAGTWRSAEAGADVDAYQGIELPLDRNYPAEAQYGLVVRGSSINRVAQDGDILTCIDIRKVRRTPNHGELVIAERTRVDGGEVETTAKRLCLNREGKFELRPDSTDPQHQEVVPYETDDADETVKVRVVGLVTWRHARVGLNVPAAEG